MISNSNNFYCTAKFSLLFIILLLFTNKTNAQENGAGEKDKWHFLAEPYIMFPNIHGYAGVGNLPDQFVYETSGDVFSHLQMGAMVYLEAQHNKWAITSDLLYMDLSEDKVKNGLLIKSGTMNVKQLGWELAGLYKILPWLEAGAGLRYNSINIKAEITSLGLSGVDTVRSREKSQSWIDPIIVTRIHNPGPSDWITEFRADIGGFGMGSKFAWQIQANVGYKWSKLFQTTFGYRWLDMNYEKGTGEDRFRYDMITFGPLLRFGFNF